ncbi:hypothetical protein D3C87_1800120 [compost metagenome]
MGGAYNPELRTIKDRPGCCALLCDCNSTVKVQVLPLKSRSVTTARQPRASFGWVWMLTRCNCSGRNMICAHWLLR